MLDSKDLRTELYYNLSSSVRVKEESYIGLTQENSIEFLYYNLNLKVLR